MRTIRPRTMVPILFTEDGSGGGGDAELPGLTPEVIALVEEGSRT